MSVANGRIPLFNGENYMTWKAQMEAILHKNRYLKIATGKTPRPTAAGNDQDGWDEKDQDARGDLLIVMEPSIVSLVKNYKTSYEIWKFLEETYDRKGTRQKAEEFRKLVNIRMDNSQAIEEYLREFNAIITRLTELDAKLDNNLLVILLLDSLPDNYKEVLAAFDALSEYPNLDTVRTRLLEIGDKKRDNIGCSGSVFKANQFRSYNYNKPKQSSYNQQYKQNYFPYNCRRCGKRGHMAKNCRKHEEHVKLSEGSEQGFMIYEQLLSSSATHEETKLNNFENKTIKWCLDSGATSHMCCAKNVFSNLHESENIGYVKLANNEKVKIMGIGTAKLCIKINNKPKYISLYNTLYIPNLKENLISVGKAADNGGKVSFEGDKAIISRGNQILVEARKKWTIHRDAEHNN